MNKPELITYLNENSTGKVAGRKEIRTNDIFISSAHHDKNFRLTRFGKDVVAKHFTEYKIPLNPGKKIVETGNHILTIDKYMVAPYYLSGGALVVYEQMVAAELLMLDGDLVQWVHNKKFYN